MRKSNFILKSMHHLCNIAMKKTEDSCPSNASLNEPRRRFSIISEYMSSTSIHGLRNIHTAYDKFHRMFWILSVLTAFGWMLYFIISSIIQYRTYPTQTVVEVVPQRDMPFPAVTVCNSNPFRKDRMMEALQEYNLKYGIYFTDQNLQLAAFKLLVEKFNENKLDELVSLGFQLSDILLDCSYNGHNCSEDFIQSVSTTYGNCFTFNWKSSVNKLFTLTDIEISTVFPEGLSMVFYLPRHLNFPMALFEDGLILLLHENDELPLTSVNGFRLRSGLAHTITFRKSQTIFLPKPYTNCTSTVSQDIKTQYGGIFDSKFTDQAAYSEPLCNELCEQAFVFSQCGCILPIPFLMRYVFSLETHQFLMANVCLPFTENETCALKARQRLLLDSDLLDKWCFPCTPQCKYTYFLSDVTALAAPTVEQRGWWASVLINGSSNVLLPDDFHVNYDKHLEMNYLRVNIQCGSRYVTINKQQPKLKVVDIFSAIGGQTGLWMGLSVLGVIEFLELLYRLVVKKFIQPSQESVRNTNGIMEQQQSH